MFLSQFMTQRQRAVEFATSGTWVVPAGVTRIRTFCVGGGGSGAGGNADSTGYGGAGGTGGYQRTADIAVTPGQTLTITLGAGGAAKGGYSLGSPGGTTSVTGTGVAIETTRAAGGEGGGGLYATGPHSSFGMSPVGYRYKPADGFGLPGGMGGKGAMSFNPGPDAGMTGPNGFSGGGGGGGASATYCPGAPGGGGGGGQGTNAQASWATAGVAGTGGGGGGGQGGSGQVSGAGGTGFVRISYRTAI